MVLFWKKIPLSVRLTELDRCIPCYLATLPSPLVNLSIVLTAFTDHLQGRDSILLDPVLCGMRNLPGDRNRVTDVFAEFDSCHSRDIPGAVFGCGQLIFVGTTALQQPVSVRVLWCVVFVALSCGMQTRPCPSCAPTPTAVLSSSVGLSMETSG